MKRDTGNPITGWLLNTTAGQTTVLLGGTALLFALSPLLFGSVTVMLKGVIGLVVPTAILAMTALFANLLYSGIRCVISTILGWVIWGFGTKGMQLCGIGQYGLNPNTLNNSDAVISLVSSSFHYLLLCSTLAVYCFHAYSQLLHPTVYDILLCGTVGAWLGAATMFTPALVEDMDRHNTSVFKLLAIGAANGLILSANQMVLGHFLCTSVLEMGYGGAVLALFVNLAAAPFLSKSLLDVFSRPNELEQAADPGRSSSSGSRWASCCQSSCCFVR